MRYLNDIEKEELELKLKNCDIVLKMEFIEMIENKKAYQFYNDLEIKGIYSVRLSDDFLEGTYIRTNNILVEESVGLDDDNTYYVIIGNHKGLRMINILKERV